MTDFEVMQMALKALEAMQSYAAAEQKGLRICDESIEALRAALERPEQQLKRIHPLDMPLEVFVEDLSTRPRNIIKVEIGFFHHSDDEYIKPPFAVRHLLMYSRKELRKWPNLGKRSLNEIEEALRNLGLQLWENHDERSLRLLREHPTYYTSPPQQQAAPVAWAVYDAKHGGSKTLHWPEQHSPHGDPEHFNAVPLYAHPSQQQSEPVAWAHNLIDNIITHRPADIDRHPERWTALYTTPQPCPTCVSLARTVMMDQTGKA